jgi:excisionase family DNA binding protein
MKEEQTTRRVPFREFITIPEVAAAKGVSRVAVLYAIRTRRLRAYRVPGRREWHIRRKDAEEYLAAPVRGRSSAKLELGAEAI